MTSVPVNRNRAIYECFGCDIDALTSTSTAYDFLLNLTEVLNMRVLSPPVVVKLPIKAAAKHLESNDYGVSGFVIWMESGAHIHTWPEFQFMTLDFFSCKVVNPQNAVSLINTTFKPLTITTDFSLREGVTISDWLNASVVR